MKKHLQAIVCTIAVCGTCGWAGPLLNTNWIVNGDAEAGAGSPDGSTVIVPDWNQLGVTPVFTAINYQSTTGGFPALSDPGPANRGTNFFGGGNNASAAGIQNLDVSSLAGQIDAGQIDFVMSAYLGGWQDQEDLAIFTAAFLDGGNNQIGNAFSLVSPNVAARGAVTELVFESQSGTIPTGTRSINFGLSMIREAGTSNDGYADNLSFVASSVGPAPSAPEPATFVMFASGGLAIVLIARKKRSR